MIASSPIKVVMAKSFMSATGQLDDAQKLSVNQFTRKLNLNPSSPEFLFERIPGVLDEHLRAVKIDRSLCAIIFKPEGGNICVVFYVATRDEAYQWSMGRRCEVHPDTGTFQTFLVKDEDVQSVERISAQLSIAAEDGADADKAGDGEAQAGEVLRDLEVLDAIDEEVARAPALGSAVNDDEDASSQEEPRFEGLFGHHSGRELRRLGVPLALMYRVRHIQTRAELEEASLVLPIDAYEALVGLAESGNYQSVLSEVTGSISYVAPKVVDVTDYAKALSTDTARAQFTVVEDEDELEKMLNEPLATWRLFLHRSQRRLVEQHSSGPVRVLGGAGTGKTVVAMHRARYLAKHVFKGADERILFTTFTQNLAMDIEESLRQLCSTALMRRIEVVHLDKWVSDFLKRQGFPRQIKYFDLSKETTRDSTLADLWTESVDSYGDMERHSRAFYREEWEQVIQAQGVTSEREYFRASRQGRGVGLTRKERQAIWPVFEEYRRQMSERGVCEREDALRAARHILEQRGDILPYRSVLVDEAQDMTNEAFKLIRQIVPEQPNDIFIVGDGHQRIYNHKVVLSHCGVHIVGRSHRLKINYRTSAQIQRFAMAVLEGQRVDDLNGEQDSLEGYRSLVQGVAPRVQVHDSLDAELETIQSFIQAPGAAASTCLVVRTNRQLDLYERALQDRGIPTYKLSRGRTEDARRPELRLATMHRVKGLEFERVILAGINEGEVPLAVAMNQSDDELVRESAELQERALFYVACSRAKREVLVTTSGEPSPFLKTLRGLQP